MINQKDKENVYTSPYHKQLLQALSVCRRKQRLEAIPTAIAHLKQEAGGLAAEVIVCNAAEHANRTTILS